MCSHPCLICISRGLKFELQQSDMRMVAWLTTFMLVCFMQDLTYACMPLMHSSCLLSRANVLSFIPLHAGSDRFQRSRKRWVLLAMWCAFAAIMIFAVAVAFPWWHYHRAALPVVLCIFAVLCAASPVSFILGFAGFGSIAAAMKEDVQQLQLGL